MNSLGETDQDDFADDGFHCSNIFIEDFCDTDDEICPVSQNVTPIAPLIFEESECNVSLQAESDRYRKDQLIQQLSHTVQSSVMSILALNEKILGLSAENGELQQLRNELYSQNRIINELERTINIVNKLSNAREEEIIVRDSMLLDCRKTIAALEVKLALDRMEYKYQLSHIQLSPTHDQKLPSRDKSSSITNSTQGSRTNNYLEDDISQELRKNRGIVKKIAFDDSNELISQYDAILDISYDHTEARNASPMKSRSKRNSLDNKTIPFVHLGGNSSVVVVDGFRRQPVSSKRKGSPLEKFGNQANIAKHIGIIAAPEKPANKSKSRYVVLIVASGMLGAFVAVALRIYIA